MSVTYQVGGGGAAALGLFQNISRPLYLLKTKGKVVTASVMSSYLKEKKKKHVNEKQMKRNKAERKERTYHSDIHLDKQPPVPARSC